MGGTYCTQSSWKIFIGHANPSFDGLFARLKSKSYCLTPSLSRDGVANHEWGALYRRTKRAGLSLNVIIM